MSQAAFSMPESFYWILFPSTSQTSEDDQFLLMELGALGTEEEELGKRLRVRGSFSSEEAWLKAREALAARPAVVWGKEPWIDWDQSWRDRQIPVKVTDRLTVCPPWVQIPPAAHHVIRLEAKMAFGTGTHESTRIAALFSESLDLKGKKLLDVGTGTGILALYCAVLVAKLSVGFDVDPVTGPCLAENRELNPVPTGSSVGFFVGTTEALAPARHFDVIICNMIRTEAWPLLPALMNGLKSGGTLVLSGQRIEDQAVWKPWFHQQGISTLREITLDEWWGFTCQLPNLPQG